MNKSLFFKLIFFDRLNNRGYLSNVDNSEVERKNFNAFYCDITSNYAPDKSV